MSRPNEPMNFMWYYRINFLRSRHTRHLRHGNGVIREHNNIAVFESGNDQLTNKLGATNMSIQSNEVHLGPSILRDRGSIMNFRIRKYFFLTFLIVGGFFFTYQFIADRIAN